jgi:transcription antitermination protein NusB
LTSRRKLREMAFRLLFQVEVGDQDPESLLERSIRQDEIPIPDRKFYRAMVRGIPESLEILDRIVEKYAKGWKVSRIARADLTILRMALYELVFHLSGMEADPPVIINEAVLLAKKYSGPDAGRFINGILGNVARDMEKKGEDIRKLTTKETN